MESLTADVFDADRYVQQELGRLTLVGACLAGQFAYELVYAEWPHRVCVGRPWRTGSFSLQSGCQCI